MQSSRWKRDEKVHAYTHLVTQGVVRFALPPFIGLNIIVWKVVEAWCSGGVYMAPMQNCSFRGKEDV